MFSLPSTPCASGSHVCSQPRARPMLQFIQPISFIISASESNNSPFNAPAEKTPAPLCLAAPQIGPFLRLDVKQ